MVVLHEDNNGLLLMVEPPNSSLQGKQTVDALFRIYKDEKKI